jgi:octopine/nopaline transport system substrate-binding protein
LRRVLRGRTIGVQASGVYEEYLNAHLAGVATVRTYRTAGERDLDLLLGRVDLTLEDSAYMKPLLAAPGSETLRIVGPALSGGMFGAGEAFAVRKGDVAMKARLDTALAALIADGTVRRLSLKWLHEDATP